MKCKKGQKYSNFSISLKSLKIFKLFNIIEKFEGGLANHHTFLHFFCETFPKQKKNSFGGRRVCQMYVRFHWAISEIKFSAIWWNQKTSWGCLPTPTTPFPIIPHFLVQSCFAFLFVFLTSGKLSLGKSCPAHCVTQYLSIFMCLVLICKGCTLLRHSHYDESFDEGGDANDQKTNVMEGGSFSIKKNNVAEFLNNFLGKMNFSK